MILIILLILAGYFGFYFYQKYKHSKCRYVKSTQIVNKVVVITGANSGIGKETAIDLARRGGKIYIACRDISRGESALEDIKVQSDSDNVHFLQLDLASFQSAREFSAKFHKLETKLDILINNAGVVGDEKMKTADGYEIHFGTNHLGHFLLTLLLLDLMKAAAPSRVVVLSSAFHSFGGFERNISIFSKNTFPLIAYCQSKLANVLFSNELARRLEGTGVTSNCLHPGIVDTGICRNHPIFTKLILKPLIFRFLRNVKVGSQTIIRVSIDPELENVTGKYFYDCEILPTNIKGRDKETAEWLWNESMRVVGLQDNIF